MKRLSVVVLASLFGIGVSTLACDGSAPSSDTATPATMEEATPASTAAQETSLYDRLGGVYSIAVVVDDFLERLLVNDTLNANAAISEAGARVPKAGLKFQVTALVCQVTGGPVHVCGPRYENSPRAPQHQRKRVGCDGGRLPRNAERLRGPNERDRKSLLRLSPPPRKTLSQ